MNPNNARIKDRAVLLATYDGLIIITFIHGPIQSPTRERTFTRPATSTRWLDIGAILYLMQELKPDYTDVGPHLCHFGYVYHERTRLL